MSAAAINERMDMIERALCRFLDHDEREALKAEYLALSADLECLLVLSGVAG